jgi:hypothetical protein
MTVLILKKKEKKMNKDYLTTDERRTFIVFKKAIDKAEEMVEHWKLTKEEKKNLRTCITFGMKVFDSVSGSLSNKALEALIKSVTKAKLTIEDKHAIEVYNKKIGSNIDSAYEENRDYYRLVELLMACKCYKCELSCKECEIADEFEEHLVPSSPDGKGNCQYAYE